MEPIEIGIAVSIGLLIFVILGMRVAFAAAIAGVWLDMDILGKKRVYR